MIVISVTKNSGSKFSADSESMSQKSITDHASINFDRSVKQRVKIMLDSYNQHHRKSLSANFQLDQTTDDKIDN